jgi:outer membrane protein assembly factor BamB
MKAYLLIFLFLLPFCFCAILAQSDKELLGEDIKSDTDFFNAMKSNRQWPSYRGFFACGYLDNTNIPDSFNVETGYNIKWSHEIPGLGLSCPAIWDDKVYITTAISENDDEGYRTGMYGDVAPVDDDSEHSWKLFCIDHDNGEILWERTMHEGVPAVKRHPKSSHANTTVATDGNNVVVFLGTEGLYCYNSEGELLWERDFGLIMAAWHVMESAEWEFSSSPVIFQNKVIIQADARNQAFVAVLDLETGETLWKNERDEIPGWTTPNIYFDDSEARVVVNGYKHRGAYDLATGIEIWKMSGGGDIPVPTPVVWKDLIFFNSAHGRHSPLMAIYNDARGEIEYPKNENDPGDDFAWFYKRGASYMSTVLVYDSLLYRLRWNGNLACYDARTGDEIYNQTIHPTSFIASPVGSDGKLYLISEEGNLYIVKAGREYNLLSRIPLGGISLVTPGITEDAIVFRTVDKIFAVSEN